MAAQMAALGLDPLVFLRCENATEVSLMIEVSKRAAKYRQVLDKNLAGEIQVAIAKLFSK